MRGSWSERHAAIDRQLCEEDARRERIERFNEYQLHPTQPPPPPRTFDEEAFREMLHEWRKQKYGDNYYA